MQCVQRSRHNHQPPLWFRGQSSFKLKVISAVGCDVVWVLVSPGSAAHNMCVSLCKCGSMFFPYQVPCAQSLGLLCTHHHSCGDTHSSFMGHVMFTLQMLRILPTILKIRSITCERCKFWSRCLGRDFSVLKCKHTNMEGIHLKVTGGRRTAQTLLDS